MITHLSIQFSLLSKHLHLKKYLQTKIMQSAVIIALFGMLAIANAGLLDAPLTVVHSRPLVYHTPVVHAVHAAPIVKTVPVVHHQPIVYHHAPLAVKTVHHTPLVYPGVRTFGGPVLLH